MKKKCSHQLGLYIFVVGLIFGFSHTEALAQFEWKFERQSDFSQAPNIAGMATGDPQYSKQSCARVGEDDVGCSSTYANSDSNHLVTPFLTEVYKMEDGKNVFHMVIGDPKDGFAQEVYIRVGYTAKTRHYRAAFSASQGDETCTTDTTFSLNLCNASDPLGAAKGNDFSGTGSGNPNHVAMRQVIGGSWSSETRTWSCQEGDGHCQEYMKDTWGINRYLDRRIEIFSSSLRPIGKWI